MDVKYSKRGFVFSFLAFFLSILIFLFGAFYLFSGDYTKDLAFKNSRVMFLNSEVSYFKDIYVKNAVSFSTYNCVNYILENQSLINQMSNNYTNMNKIFSEMMINGSNNGIGINSLNETNVNYLVSLYSKDFAVNYRGNFTYTVNSINVYEETPFYLSVQVYGTYNVTTVDNFSSWYFNDSFKISIPILETRDPEFTLNNGQNYSIRYVDLYSSNINWSESTLNDTIINVYSALYTEPGHKYNLGTSFLNRLLNITRSSYKNVIGFYSFDYDDGEKRVFDSTYNHDSYFFGNTRLLFNFQNESIMGVNIDDYSDYNNLGILMGSINCNLAGIYKEDCDFDGVSSQIRIADSDSLHFSNNSFSIVAWVNFNTASSIFDQEILYKQNSFVLKKTNMSGGNSVDFSIWDGVDFEPRLSIYNVTNNSWNMLVATYDGNITSLYLNGIFINSSERGNFNTNSFSDLYLGSSGASSFLNGSLDEVGLYSKCLSVDEISILYKTKRALQIDYKDSLYGKGIEFDGIDDFINSSWNNSAINLNNYTIEFWINPSSENFDSSLTQGILSFSNNSNLLRFFYNGANKLEFDFMPANSGNLLANFTVEEWQYFVITSDGSIVKLYRNGKLEDSRVVDLSLENFNNTIMGGNSTILNYKGILDEVKVYQRVLLSEEITENYYNYASASKGCCNYITVINPNLMGYNSTLYNSTMVSYGSKLFFDHYNRGINYNITLWNLSMTSGDTDENFYNFILDDCMMQTFNVYSYDFNVSLVNMGQLNDSCFNYVSEGLY